MRQKKGRHGARQEAILAAASAVGRQDRMFSALVGIRRILECGADPVAAHRRDGHSRFSQKACEPRYYGRSRRARRREFAMLASVGA